MSKSKSDVDTEEEVDEVEETDEATVRTVNLDRTYTYEGKHYGPGKVDIQARSNEQTDKIADSLEAAQKRLQASESGQSGNRRRDKSTTGVVNKGTDRELDNGPRERAKAKDDEDEDEDEEVLYSYNDEENLTARDLWGFSDKELKSGGLSKAKVKAIRKAQKEAEEAEDAGKADEDADENA